MAERYAVQTGTPIRKIFAVGVIAIAAIVLLVITTMTFESMDANQIMVVQSPIDGELTWHTTAGIKWQGFGKITFYPKRDIHHFGEGDGIKIRFNDGAHARMFGSIQYEMPLDAPNLTQLHVQFGSREAIQRQLIETITNKSVYMTGPLMSSKESYAEKRNDLIRFVEDQVSHGVYQTTQKDMKVPDPMTGVEKTVTIVQLVMDKNGVPQRQEAAYLASFGIKPFNFAIDSLPYDLDVEAQIKQQQALTMEVQTEIAGAKKAEQRAITAEKEGQAAAAKSKWEQEVIKARVVTEAEQKLAVATLAAKAAEQTKREQILLGEGEAARKSLVMKADGALEKKLAAYIEVQKNWAENLAKYPGSLVPLIVSGDANGKAAAGSGTTELMDIFTVMALKNLGLDMTVGGQTRTRAEQ